MRVLITGAGGQLGQELARTAPPTLTVKAVDRRSLDISDETAIHKVFEEFQPALVLNAAAYTAVDKAESEPELAWHINARGPTLLAEAVRQVSDCRLIHISTDYVFDGNASRPYRPDDKTAPLGVYGQTKLEGELAALQTLGLQALVLRAAWVYGPIGKNFLQTMLRLMRKRGSARVVNDQIGCPTTTGSLAELLWRFAERPDLSGTYHWADAGVASWYDFAVAIAEEAAARGLLPGGIEVNPVGTEDYPAVAKRPRFSLLDSRATAAALHIAPLHWRVRLRQVLDEIAHG